MVGACSFDAVEVGPENIGKITVGPDSGTWPYLSIPSILHNTKGPVLDHLSYMLTYTHAVSYSYPQLQSYHRQSHGTMPELDKRNTQIYTVPEIYRNVRESLLSSKQDSRKASVKSRRGQPHEDDPPDHRADRNGLQLPRTSDISPWTDYKKSYELRLGIGIRVVVAVQKNFPYDEVTVREFSDSNIEDKLRVLKENRHPNIVSILDIFRFEEKAYVILEHMPLSLHHLSQSRLPLDDIQLAAIVGQVRLEAYGLARYRILTDSDRYCAAFCISSHQAWNLKG